MGYALPMSSSFVYQPHVQQSDGTIITPDILIERVYASGADGVLTPVPVTRVTSAAALQQSAGAPMGVPAVVLVAASYGLQVSVGAILEDFLPLARTAWRHDDIADGYDDIELRSWAVHGGKRIAFVSEKLSALMSPADAMATLGNASGLKPGTAVFIGHPVPLGESLSVERFDVALDAGGPQLQYSFVFDTLG